MEYNLNNTPYTSYLKKGGTLGLKVWINESTVIYNKGQRVGCENKDYPVYITVRTYKVKVSKDFKSITFSIIDDKEKTVYNKIVYGNYKDIDYTTLFAKLRNEFNLDK